MDERVLVVEDDDITRRLLASVLADAGYQVTQALDGTVALQLLEQQQFDVVVTDIRMREVDGVAVMNAARSQQMPPEVILLTGHGSLQTAVAALRAGAFNYLLKPCASTELLSNVAEAIRHHVAEQRRLEAMRVIAQEYARIQSNGVPDASPVAAHPGAPSDADLSGRFLNVGALSLDVFRHAAILEGRTLHLTPTEFAFLCCLAETPGRVVSCPEIVRRTHGYDAKDTEAQVLLRAHVRNLRRKIPASYLITVRSIGYMLVDPHETINQEVVLSDKADR
jgi:DNA-binding response OmpR family regulator